MGGVLGINVCPDVEAINFLHYSLFLLYSFYDQLLLYEVNSRIYHNFQLIQFLHGLDRHSPSPYLDLWCS